MRQSCDRLHLNRVALVERVVKDARCINYLPASILVVRVAHEEVLRREGIGLHIDVRICNIIDEAGLADIGEARDNQCARICVD